MMEILLLCIEIEKVVVEKSEPLSVVDDCTSTLAREIQKNYSLRRENEEWVILLLVNFTLFIILTFMRFF